ncbi:MAG TPA: hypothetical protein VNZ62_13320 [Capillimicrobium sp.]|nr:hypothetical protein [Capillimicrobium sp.]
MSAVARTAASRLGLPLGPIAACALAAVVALLATGVRPLEVLAIGGYEVLFVGAPGIAALRLLQPRLASPLAWVALGWPLGYAIEVVVFAFGTAIGAQWLMWALPVAAGALAAVAWRRRRGGPPAVPPAPASAPAWATAGIVVTALAVLGFGLFSTYPIPRNVDGVVLYADHVFDVTLMAEASHHWPLTNPNVSGEPLRYHVLSFVHGAALGTTTGVELDVVVLRALPVTVLCLVALQVAWLATRVAPRRRWVPPGAVAVLLLAGELDLDPFREAPFLGLFLGNLVLSPSNALALPFAIGAIGLVLGVIAARRAPGARTWILLAALTAGAVASKGSALPVLLGSLGLYVVARLVLDRVVDRRAIAALGVAAAASIVVYLALFSGGGEAGATIDPLGYLDYGLFADGGGLGHLARDLALTAALLAPWAGAVLLIGRVRGRARLRALWLGCVVVTGLLLFALISQPGLAQVYFKHLAAPAGAVLSVWGIARAWPAMSTRRTVAIGLALLAAGVAVAGAIGIAEPDAAEPPASLYAVWLGALAVLIVVATIAAAPRRAAWPACAIVVLVAFTVLDGPLDGLPPWLKAEREGRAHHIADAAAGPRGINQELLRALTWLRDHSDPDDVIATDTHLIAEGSPYARYFYPGAYSERRTFLGAWDYTAEGLAATEGGPPAFAVRRRLNEAAYAGDTAALARLRDDYGVRYLIVDEHHAGPAPGLAGLPLAYESPNVRIYRLDDG